MYVGVETGGTKVVCAAGTGPDDLRATTSFATTRPEETLGRITAFVAGHADGLQAIGVASFGPVDLRAGSPTYGRVTATPKPGWGGVDVVGPLADRFGVPVGFDTDVGGAALAEGRWGAARRLDTLAYVTVGTGVGVGVVAGGRLVHGLVHPEAGHLLVRRHPEDAFDGICPFHGDCLEGLASGPALEARWGRPAHELDGADRDRAVAIEASYLAHLAATLVVVVSPERIVVGGGVANLPGLLDAVRAGTGRLLGGYPGRPGPGEMAGYLVRPGLGERAGVLGGIALAERAHLGG